MIASIRKFFDQFIEPGASGEGNEGERALHIATAALLLEMMRMDDRYEASERSAVVDALRQQFGLDAAQLATLLALADEAARNAVDYFQFTSLINKGCGPEQKIRIVENLWRVAFADGHLDAHEQHLMRKIADLLYVGHADYHAAKVRARTAADLPRTDEDTLP